MIAEDDIMAIGRIQSALPTYFNVLLRSARFVEAKNQAADQTKQQMGMEMRMRINEERSG